MIPLQPHFSCQDSVLSSELLFMWQELPCPDALSYATVISALLPSLEVVGWAELLQSLTDHFSFYCDYSKQCHGVSFIPYF